MRKFLNLVLFVGLTLSSNAQSNFWEGGLFFGGSMMSGDLVAPNFGSLNDINFAYGLMARRYVHSNFALRANLLRSRLSASDRRYSQLRDRGYQTETSLTELSFDFEWDILGHRRERKEVSVGNISPYIFLGVGVALTNPKTVYGNLSREAILDQNAEVSSTRFVMPMGAGLRLDMTQAWSLGVEVAPRATFSDYLDGVSMAGNPEKNDWYGFGSIQLWYKGAIADKDRDGIADTEDACPEIAGSPLTMGCPDRDHDEVPDHRDICPDIAGTKALGGCPDSDNDGIADHDDTCPTEAGTSTTNGCPDTDGDGIANNEDNCPNEGGPLANNGCPYQDTDGDGIWDKDDKCPDTKGIVANQGCPKVVPQQAPPPEVLDFSTRHVRFSTDTDEFLTSSYRIMNELAQVMRNYPAYNLIIEGYTDNRGTITYNQTLSESRAKRCHAYLQMVGIPTSRMRYAGYGESNPIATNETEAGRFQNRRVEFSLYKE